MTRPSALRHIVLAAFFALRFAVAQTTLPKPEANQEQPWKEYVYANDGFAITLPAAPHPHKDSQMADGTAYTIYLPRDLSVTLHVGNFSAGCADVFREYLSTVKRTYSQAKDGAWTNSKPSFRVDLSSVREIKIAGYPAVEYEQEIAAAKGTFKDYERVQCVDKKLYILTATWPIGPPKSADLTRVINSFRLLAR